MPPALRASGKAQDDNRFKKYIFVRHSQQVAQTAGQNRQQALVGAVAVARMLGNPNHRPSHHGPSRHAN